MTCRVGHGFDVHPFSDDPARRLVLGGVTFEGGTGLVGHSDADAVAHAVIDALLGAAGLGDIGQHFPDTDPAFADADSLELLRQAAAAVRARRVGARQRRLHRRAGGPEAGAASAPRWRSASAMPSAPRSR